MSDLWLLADVFRQADLSIHIEYTLYTSGVVKFFVQIGCGVESVISKRMIVNGINKYQLVFMNRLSAIISPIFVRFYLCNETVVHPIPATINALKYR